MAHDRRVFSRFPSFDTVKSLENIYTIVTSPTQRLLERRAGWETTFGSTKYLKNPDLARPLQALLACVLSFGDVQLRCYSEAVVKPGLLKPLFLER